jgi:long-chain acyl-CoA synthetase
MTPLPPLDRVLAGRHLVVTGVTGFVGKVWLSHLLRHVPSIGKVTVLVRGGRRESATARFARVVDTNPAFRPLRDHVDDVAGFLDARVEVLDADVARPGCGLDPHTRARLAETADAIVHFAGLTDFRPDPRKALPVNVDGALHVADLAELLRVPRLLHVSTCYVAGVADGEVPEVLRPGISPRGARFDVDDEIRLARAIAASEADATARTDRLSARAEELGWPNLYTYTKGLAEHALARRDLELAIVRPSVVECARSFPFPGWNEGLNTSGPIMAFCGTAFRELPSTASHRFDIVPVDAVARWTTLALARLLRGEHERVYQMGSSDTNPATFARIVELTALGKRRHAGRPGASLVERLVAQLDVAPARVDELGWMTPERLETLGRDLHAWLGDVDPGGRTGLVGRLAAPVSDAVKEARKRLQRANRNLGRLRRMLEQYRPFVHDHDWCFRTDHVRAEVAALDPADRAEFGDDLSTLCWRSYWLDVQYAGMVRWSFPLLEGRDAPLDPPSDPPLVLGRTPHPWDTALVAEGVA